MLIYICTHTMVFSYYSKIDYTLPLSSWPQIVVLRKVLEKLINYLFKVPTIEYISNQKVLHFKSFIRLIQIRNMYIIYIHYKNISK